MVDRKKLIIQIINEQQRNWSSRSNQSFICLICGTPGDHNNADLHEAFVRRGRNVPDELVMTFWNCAVVHHTCHIPEGQTTETKLKIWRHKAAMGIDIPYWIDDLNQKIKAEVSLPTFPEEDEHRYRLPPTLFDLEEVIE